VLVLARDFGLVVFLERREGLIPEKNSIALHVGYESAPSPPAAESRLSLLLCGIIITGVPSNIIFIISASGGFPCGQGSGPGVESVALNCFLYFPFL
jgi:hypothetical protein